MKPAISCPIAAILVAASLSSLLAIAAPATASTAVDLRVASKSNQNLIAITQYTGTTTVPTSPKARCFYGSQGGSGDPFHVSGPNAIGALADSSRVLGRVSPLLITDEYSFGLGVCAIGGVQTPSSGYWNIRVNHVSIPQAGDRIDLDPGDQVLWALVSPSCLPDPPYTCEQIPELELKAPRRAQAGQPFDVTVFEYSENGQRKRAVGATVNSALAPTDANGVTQVTLSKRGKLKATRTGSIHSGSESVCVGNLKQCPGPRDSTLIGSPRKDQIKGGQGRDLIKPGRGADSVRGRDGDDLIVVKGGGADSVNCGGGTDVVRADDSDTVAGNCEHVSGAGHGA